MNIVPLSFPTKEEAYQKTLFEFDCKGVEVKFGTVLLQKGSRIPEEGFSRHPQYEISYLKKGKIQMLHTDGSELGILQTGDVIKIEAMEAQAGYILEDTEIIYVLIG
ncbi:MAG: hypothetical protein AAF696_18450 [Bacteroidota bacterium]